MFALSVLGAQSVGQGPECDSPRIEASAPPSAQFSREVSPAIVRQIVAGRTAAQGGRHADVDEASLRVGPVERPDQPAALGPLDPRGVEFCASVPVGSGLTFWDVDGSVRDIRIYFWRRQEDAN